MPFIVSLEPGVWLAKGQGDPPRTLDIRESGEWTNKKDAQAALTRARKFRKFEHAYITFVA